MKEKPLEEARVRLKRVHAAVDRLEAPSPPFAELEEAWWVFILAASSVYAKLEQSCKGHGPSEGWYGRMKHIRKKDALLSYVHHARNSEFHGLSTGADPTAGKLKVTKGGYGVYDAEGNLTHAYATQGVPFEMKLTGIGIRLITVTDDLHHDKFDPPTSHLGQQLTDGSPKAVARLCLSYLESLIEAASELPVHV